jgi:hypothetical protein
VGQPLRGERDVAVASRGLGFSFFLQRQAGRAASAQRQRRANWHKSFRRLTRVRTASAGGWASGNGGRVPLVSV